MDLVIGQCARDGSEMIPRSIRWLGGALVVALLGSACLQSGPQPSSSPAAIASAAPSPTATASPSPSGGFVNAVLGYRITLPTAFRRSLGRIYTGQDLLGFDYYTIVTEAQTREACLKDPSELGPPPSDQFQDVRVDVWRNVRGISALEWVNTPTVPGGYVRSTHMKAQAATVDGREAVRLVEDNANASTTAIVIRGTDRIYHLWVTGSLPQQLPKTWLDDIAKTFATVEPAAFPSPTATVAPTVATAELGAALAKAFTVKDVDAIARLMPDCSISAGHLVDLQLLGSGGLSRSTVLFTQALRDRFAAGDLTVTVDPAVQFRSQNGGEYFVRSQWRESDRTTPIDLIFNENDGRWRWGQSLHYYTKAQVINGCIPYRSPWTSAKC